MTVSDSLPTTPGLAERAQRHLWGHFSTLAPDDLPPVILRGEGCYVWDDTGKRYLDGLAGLFTVQVGHGRHELAEAARRQAEQLGYFPLWTYAHPTGIELAEKIASLTPGDLNRVFFTTGGGEAVESAWKLARQYHRATGQPGRYKVVARDLAYHGTSMGALAITGLAAIKTAFEPLTPGGIHVRNTNQYRCTLCHGGGASSGGGCTLACADEIAVAIEREGPETVAAVFLEPVQNSGGCFTPPDGYFARVREICDEYGVLLVSDEVICAFGRLGEWFGAIRYDYQPDMITMAKGLTSGYAPLGAVAVSDRIAEPFLGGDTSFLHGITFGGHPVSCAVALANIALMEREDVLGNVRAHEATFRAALEDLADLPIVGDVRGAGYFWGVELVKDRATRTTFDADESHHLLRGVLSKRLLDHGLICRADDRGDPVVQFSPPLVAGPDQIAELAGAVRASLLDAMRAMEGDRR
jgi:adenosylmethionine-8-amino-7-oxononanoate aminotransferase